MFSFSNRDSSRADTKLSIKSTELLQRIKEGDDTTAWTNFVQRYGRRLYGYFRTQIGITDEDAQDLTQEVFVRISLHVHSFTRDKGRARQWILGIARNAWIDTLRKQRNKPVFEAIKGIDPENIAAEFDEEYLDGVVADALSAVLDHLQNVESDPERASQKHRVFRLRWRDNWAVGKIADREGVSLHQVYRWNQEVEVLFKEEIKKMGEDLG